MDNTVGVNGEQFIARVAQLMVRLFCLPGEQRRGAMAALLGDIEERLESSESLNRDEFLALLQRALDNEEHRASRQDANTLRADEPV